MLTRSQNSYLLSMYPSSSISRVVNRVEAPGSVFILLTLHCWPVRFDLMLTSFCCLCSCLCFILFLPFFISSFWILYVLYFRNNLDICSSATSDKFWVFFEDIKKIFIFIPPSLVSSDSRSYSKVSLCFFLWRMV